MIYLTKLTEFNSTTVEILIFIFVTVGNKCDCSDRKLVSTADAKKFAEQMGIQLFEASAKDNINIENVGYQQK